MNNYVITWVINLISPLKLNFIKERTSICFQSKAADHDEELQYCNTACKPAKYMTFVERH